ncbi:hypothetical protein GCM10016455_28620 [Aliiroseovarius zhejiangensis]|uniref:Uncharacterized protein n=1 Tax=Aliiroseovarius zhejiangensis TaxID=1632025 RepID=A0ABQ3J5G8_9RHOB|nr:hypothetical protein [Aliiroseovarius zhejiangensis]GHF05774.1 hypothetical protein GCM10016455_28620 [Aliiroseovarius zhejiangensis]
MKAFLAALAALVVITIGANQILVNSGFSASSVTASPGNVRLHD